MLSAIVTILSLSIMLLIIVGLLISAWRTHQRRIRASETHLPSHPLDPHITMILRDPHLKMCLCLIETTVNPLLKIGLRKLLTELVAEKGVRGIARGRQKVLLLIVLDHGKECL